MNFSAEYQLTFEEYVEYCRYIQLSRRDRAVENKRLPRPLVGLVFALGFFVLIYYLTHNGNRPVPLEDIPFPLWFAIILVICAVTIPWRRGSRREVLRKAWEKSRFAERQQKVEFTDSGLTVAHLTAESRMSWEHFVRFEESRSLFFLFQTERSAYPIPKRIFKDAAEINDWRTFLRQAIGGPTGAFPVVPIDPSKDHRPEEEND